MDYGDLAVPALIEKCALKDGLAWSEFVKRFSPFMAFCIKKALGKHPKGSGAGIEDIKDIRQGVIIDIWDKERLLEIRNRKDVRYWLAIVSRNAAISHLRKKGKEVLVSDISCFERPFAETPREEENEQNRKRLEEIYGGLSQREKIIFNLYFKKGLKIKDVSKITGSPLGSISSALTRIKKRIGRR